MSSLNLLWCVVLNWKMTKLKKLRLLGPWGCHCEALARIFLLTVPLRSPCLCRIVFPPPPPLYGLLFLLHSNLSCHSVSTWFPFLYFHWHSRNNVHISFSFCVCSLMPSYDSLLSLSFLYLCHCSSFLSALCVAVLISWKINRHCSIPVGPRPQPHCMTPICCLKTIQHTCIQYKHLITWETRM